VNCKAGQSPCVVGQWPLCAAVFIAVCCISCITPNISYPPCCKLAQVVALSSPPFNVKLSVPLPSSCNAAPLIAKATALHKELAFHQPITQYQILCCYRVCKSGLLNEQWLREIVKVDREMLGAVVKLCAVFSINRHFTFSITLIIYILHCKYFVVYN